VGTLKCRGRNGRPRLPNLHIGVSRTRYRMGQFTMKLPNISLNSPYGRQQRGSLRTVDHLFRVQIRRAPLSRPGGTPRVLVRHRLVLQCAVCPSHHAIGKTSFSVFRLNIALILVVPRDLRMPSTFAALASCPSSNSISVRWLRVALVCWRNRGSAFHSGGNPDRIHDRAGARSRPLSGESVKAVMSSFEPKNCAL
jgi:hypothetical protein